MTSPHLKGSFKLKLNSKKTEVMLTGKADALDGLDPVVDGVGIYRAGTELMGKGIMAQTMLFEKWVSCTMNAFCQLHLV